MDAAIFKEKLYEFVRKKRAYRDNSTKVFTFITSQCSQATKAKFEVQNDWRELKPKHDVLKLLNAIMSILLNQLQNDFRAGITAYKSIRVLLEVRFGRYEQTAEYHKRFIVAKEVLERFGVKFRAMFQIRADKILRLLHRKTQTAATDAQVIEAE